MEKKTEKKNCIEAVKNKKKKIVRKKNLTEFELWWMKIVPGHKYNVYSKQKYNWECRK